MAQEALRVIHGIRVQGDIGEAHERRHVIRPLPQNAAKRLLRDLPAPMPQGVERGGDGFPVRVDSGRAAKRIASGEDVAPFDERVAEQFPRLAAAGGTGAAGLQALDGLVQASGLSVGPREIECRLHEPGRERDGAAEVLDRGLGVTPREADGAEQPQRVHFVRMLAQDLAQPAHRRLDLAVPQQVLRLAERLSNGTAVGHGRRQSPRVGNRGSATIPPAWPRCAVPARSLTGRVV